MDASVWYGWRLPVVLALLAAAMASLNMDTRTGSVQCTSRLLPPEDTVHTPSLSSWPRLLFTPAEEVMQGAEKTVSISPEPLPAHAHAHVRAHAIGAAAPDAGRRGLGDCWQVARDKSLQSRRRPFLHLSGPQEMVLVKY